MPKIKMQIGLRFFYEFSYLRHATYPHCIRYLLDDTLLVRMHEPTDTLWAGDGIRMSLVGLAGLSATYRGTAAKGLFNDDNHHEVQIPSR